MKSTDMREGSLLHLKERSREKRFAMMESARPAGTKHRRMVQREALFNFFLQHVDPYAFYYDRERDEMTVYRAFEKGTVEEVTEKGFFGRLGLGKKPLDGASKDPVVAAFYDAIMEPQALTFFFAETETDEEHSWRVDCTSIADGEGRVSAICGMVSETFVEDEEEDRGVPQVVYSQNPQTKLFDQDAFAGLVMQRLTELRASEKGVLFVVGIDAFQEIVEELGKTAYDSYLSMLSEVLHADVRAVDILGRLDDQSVGIFISGCISIDIVEKRAQQILDLFLRVQPKDFHPITFSMGIAIRGVSSAINRLSFDKMENQAKEAMQSARNFGPNRYRMYDDL